ncbi:MAG: UDP-3-O-(3-hydroxymyristoyl)glucosamine N-acyltransferase [Bacteroidales bacterium]|nr:UDP-3-O-(3-hydroxymyristoyl)glucosamine N-acyltransferase [Bacteroidales bacterium]
MEFSAEQIANLLKGKVVGQPGIKVNNISKIEEGKKGSLAFLANPKYTPYIYTTKASIVLVNKDFNPEKEVKTTMIFVDNAYEAFASLLEVYQNYKTNKSGISKSAEIEKSAEIGKDVYLGANIYIGKNSIIGNNTKIYPNSYIGDNVIIGSNTIIFAGTNIYSESVIGNNCTFHSGTVIGSDGFGFAPQTETEFKKVPQIGNVIIEDNVEIGANTTIDRATIGSTIIRKGVKLDNLVQIAHNVEIGKNTVIASQTGVSGSTKIGKNCMIGGQVGFAGHLVIGNNVKIGAQSGVHKNIKDGAIMQGTPVLAYRNWYKAAAIIKQLPELKQQVDKNTKNLNK